MRLFLALAVAFLLVQNAAPLTLLLQGGLDYGWWAHDFRVVSEDVPGTQLNADRRKYVITVPANGRREAPYGERVVTSPSAPSRCPSRRRSSSARR